MANNLVTYYVDPTARTAREAQVPNASFTNGCNNAASNANGVGINTGSYDPKASDWPRPAVQAIQTSQIIGGTKRNLFCKDATFGDDSLVAFAKTTGSVAPDATVATIATKVFKNRTGVTLPINTWLWSVADA